MNDHCDAATTIDATCAVAFTPLYVGGYPCHEDINASPADDFFTYSTPADPEMMPWRCSQPDALRALASAFTPSEERSAWWCTPETGSYGVKMMTLGFSIGKADDRWRKREREVMASVLAALTGFGLQAEIDRDHGWIVLADHKRPYRVPVLPAELRC